jgi:hypothetical protein
MSLQLATWGASGGGGLKGLPDEDVASEMAELLGEYDIEAAPIDLPPRCVESEAPRSLQPPPVHYTCMRCPLHLSPPSPPLPLF